VVAQLSTNAIQATFDKFLNHQALGRWQANTFVGRDAILPPPFFEKKSTEMSLGTL
jgi:hypothetical protein